MKTRQTETFARWFKGLRDDRARSKIAARLVRIEAGNLGDTKSVGDGVSEARVDYGPGYRLYFTQRARSVILLLVGGDKQLQRRDIERAKSLAREIDEADWVNDEEQDHGPHERVRPRRLSERWR